VQVPSSDGWANDIIATLNDSARDILKNRGVVDELTILLKESRIDKVMAFDATKELA